MQSTTFLPRLGTLSIACALAALSASTFAQVRVINSVPAVQSNEVEANNHPSIAVDPTNRQRIAAWARTDDVTGLQDKLWVSLDGGITWTVTPRIGAQFSNSSAALAFSRTGALFVAVDENGVSGFRIYRATNIFSNFDQITSEFNPTVSAAQLSVQSVGGTERLLVLANESDVAVAGKIDNAMQIPNTTLNRVAINRRANAFQKGDGDYAPLASHADGSSYTVLRGNLRKTNLGAEADIIVLKDSANSTTRFDALFGADRKVGVVVAVRQRSFARFGFFETNAQTAIAVDPRNSSHVVLAYQEGFSVASNKLHLKRSMDGGQTWSNDIRVIAGGINPSLVFNSDSRLAFMYQTESATRLVTTLEESDSVFINATGSIKNVLSDAALLQTSSNNQQDPGPNTALIADGRHFVGMFASPNTANLANFPIGVNYQRKVNWTTQKLLGNDGTTTVQPSFDPFVVISERN